jgi:hypothetical protein
VVGWPTRSHAPSGVRGWCCRRVLTEVVIGLVRRKHVPITGGLDPFGGFAVVASTASVMVGPPPPHLNVLTPYAAGVCRMSSRVGEGAHELQPGQELRMLIARRSPGLPGPRKRATRRSSPKTAAADTRHHHRTDHDVTAPTNARPDNRAGDSHTRYIGNTKRRHHRQVQRRSTANLPEERWRLIGVLVSAAGRG